MCVCQTPLFQKFTILKKTKNQSQNQPEKQKQSQKQKTTPKCNQKKQKTTTIANKNRTTQPGFLAHFLEGSTPWRAFWRTFEGGSTFWRTFGGGSTFWCTFGRVFFHVYFLRRRVKSRTFGHSFCKKTENMRKNNDPTVRLFTRPRKTC